MSELILQLPETLHHQLERLAQDEGVSLSNYILYVLARQTAHQYAIEVIPPARIGEQRTSYEALLQKLGQASDEEVEAILAERPLVEPEPDLTPETIQKLKQLFAQGKNVGPGHSTPPHS